MWYTTAANQRLELVDEPFAEGGEGRLHEIEGKPRYVAKIYKSAARARACEGKIRAMVELPAHRSLPANLAWPQNILLDDAGAFAGFVMERVGESVAFPRLYAYPGSAVPIKQRVAACISLADTYGRLHRCGQAVGDPNPDNIRVLKDCSVVLLDTDSFAIRALDGRLFRCEVCREGYAAPEMLAAVKGGLRYSEAARAFDEGSDRFGLAVHIFRCLFNGCHPMWFAKDPDAGVSRSLPALNRCAELGASPFWHQVDGLRRAPFAPPLDAMPPYLRDAFREALIDGCADPRRRPSAFAWRDLLARYLGELVECGNSKVHAFWPGAGDCPYCAVEGRPRRRRKAPSRRSRAAGVRTAAASAAPKVPAAAAAPAMPAAAAATVAPQVGRLNVRQAGAPACRAIPPGSLRARWKRFLHGGRPLPKATVSLDMLAFPLAVGAVLLAIDTVLGLPYFWEFARYLIGVAGEAEAFACGLAGFVTGWKAARKLAAYSIPARAAGAAAASVAGMLAAVVAIAAVCVLLGMR